MPVSKQVDDRIITAFPQEHFVALNNVPPGKDLPNDFNVIIEISMRSDPIK